MKNKWAKIMAFIALLAIIASVVSTWILFIIESSKKPKMEISEEQLKEILKSQSWAKTWTWVKILTGSLKTWTWEIK